MSDEFGAPVVKYRDPPKIQRTQPGSDKKNLTTHFCSNCGCLNVEVKWWCYWLVADSRWQAANHCDEESYCPDCQDVVEIEESTIEEYNKQFPDKAY